MPTLSAGASARLVPRVGARAREPGRAVPRGAPRGRGEPRRGQRRRGAVGAGGAEHRQVQQGLSRLRVQIPHQVCECDTCACTRTSTVASLRVLHLLAQYTRSLKRLQNELLTRLRLEKNINSLNSTQVLHLFLFLDPVH